MSLNTVLSRFRALSWLVEEGCLLYWPLSYLHVLFNIIYIIRIYGGMRDSAERLTDKPRPDADTTAYAATRRHLPANPPVLDVDWHLVPRLRFVRRHNLQALSRVPGIWDLVRCPEHLDLPGALALS